MCQPFLLLFFNSPQITLQEVISCSSTLKWFEVQNHVLNRGTRKPIKPLTLNLPCGGPDTISFSVAVSNVTPRYGFPWWVLMLHITNLKLKTYVPQINPQYMIYLPVVWIHLVNQTQRWLALGVWASGGSVVDWQLKNSREHDMTWNRIRQNRYPW